MYAPDEQNPDTGRGHFTPDGRRVVLLSDRIVRVWDPDTPAILTDLDGHDAIVKHAVFSPDGARLITLSGATLRTWELATGELVSRDRIGVVEPGGGVSWPTHPRDLTRLACERLRMLGRVADQAHDICAPLLDASVKAAAPR